MITADVVRNYLAGWGFSPGDFDISDHVGTVVVYGKSTEAVSGAAHYLRFCLNITVNQRSPNHIWVYEKQGS
jgi:hypothetical protein